MSRGNLFMGYGRGKVGSVVLARSKGQQIARAYNDKPKNPRSNSQMAQRSIFMAATKFYTNGVKAFFQFAFENKDSRLSDYNAFVSENAKAGLRLSQAAYQEPSYPSIGHYMMTKGSLGELPLALNSGKTAFELSAIGLAASANLGALSKSLKDTYGLMEGDIITLTVITANGSNADNTPSIEPDKRGKIDWSIKQFVIDESSEAAVADVLGAIATTAAGALVITPTAIATSAVGACITASRQTNEGLKVSNTYLALNDIAEQIYEAGQTDSYNGQVLASWNASGEAILQGSLVQ